MEVKTSIPGLREANKLMADIKKLGIDDVELMYDKSIQPYGMWAVVQVFKPSGKILLLSNPKTYETQPTLMWWCKTEDGLYRNPSDRDLHDIIVTVKRAEVWFDKGSDYMIDKIEKQEKEQYDKNRAAQTKKIRDAAPALKKAIRKELT